MIGKDVITPVIKLTSLGPKKNKGRKNGVNAKKNCKKISFTS